jgi:hypothetical protein
MGSVMGLGLGLAAVLAASVVAAAAPSSPARAATVTENMAPLPDEIPTALQGFTKCMVETAKAAPNVMSATRGVMTRNDKTFVFVRVEYRIRNGYEFVATYSRERDRPLDKGFMFSAFVSGLSPACDEGPDGERDCDNVRRWDAARHALGPVEGFAPPEVTAAWRNACGVNVLGMMG